MKQFGLKWFGACMFILVVVGCSPEVQSPPKQLLISGSDTEAKMIEKLVNEFEENMDLDGKISVSSSGTEQGIESLINGEISVANASRPMTQDEIARAWENSVNPIEVIVAHDAVAVVTNIKLGVDSLSTDQLREIFSGEITNWSSVGGPNLPIQLIGRKKGSGTRSFFKERMAHDGYAQSIIEFETSQEVLAAVKKVRGAIGYVGVGYVMDHKGKPAGDIWGMYIYSGEMPAISPYERSKVRAGMYGLSRPLYQYFDGMPTGEIMDFLQFELSKQGQELIENYGYFAINESHKQQNLFNGIFVFHDWEEGISTRHRK
ncbi:MAG: phosphate ABC transporter substrate-binding protein [Flavobacteriales bacterium]|nr:phosphate ABC transporter substrate-binding protein [Flavobacteriales bacterium]